MKYRVYFGRYGYYMSDKFDTQEAAEQAGNATRYDFMVINERNIAVANKTKFSGLIRIPEKKMKQD